ncbi:MAG: hypothetical protein IJU45_03880 [Clostridia bacterium]|nr:hypothetical protein [Clostridia bacterium]
MDIPPNDIIKMLNSKNRRQQQDTALKMLSELDENQSRQVKSIMQDEEKLRSILQSPEAQQLMNKLKGFKNG